MMRKTPHPPVVRWLFGHLAVPPIVFVAAFLEPGFSFFIARNAIPITLLGIVVWTGCWLMAEAWHAR